MHRLLFLLSAALLFGCLHFTTFAAQETMPPPLSRGVEVLAERLCVFHT